MGVEPKKRLDQLLLDRGLAANLQEARAFIMAGKVLIDEQRFDKPGTLVAPGAPLRLKDHKRFVSRGGDKLWAGIEDLELAHLFVDAIVLDCGASTGGFTDCSLQLGAKKVYALDVGSNQLAWKLRSDPRIVVMEQTDIRDLEGELDPEITLVLADISFNSLDRLLPAICRAVPGVGQNFILLVKPQFELTVDAVPAGGVVTNDQDRQTALEIVRLAMDREGLGLQRAVDSRILGRTGNREIFVWGIRR